MSVTPRRVFITGGGSGLGAALASHCAQSGHAVAIAGRNEERLRGVTDAAARLGSDIRACRVDVRDNSALADAIESFAPTAVVCCASILGRASVYDALTPELFREVQDINTCGTFNACRAAMTFWRGSRRPGDVVNVSSLAGLRGLQRFEGVAAYAASKHAVIGLTEALALEGRHFGIRVNAIAPGAMRTPMSLSLGLSPQTGPEAIVPTIEFLLDRERSGALTGSTIEIHCND